MNYKTFIIPIQIKIIPEIIFQILCGIEEILLIDLPNNLPIHRKSIWKELVSIGNKNELIPIVLQPKPILIESKDIAIPKNTASLISILFELSKSELMGSFIMFMVIPRNSIKKLYSVCLKFTSLFFSFLNIAPYNINTPMSINIEAPTMQEISDEIYADNMFPKVIETLVKNILNINRIIIAEIDIFVFLIPYVIPTPNESILAEMARIIAFTSINNTSLHNMHMSKKCYLTNFDLLLQFSLFFLNIWYNINCNFIITFKLVVITTKNQKEVAL